MSMCGIKYLAEHNFLVQLILIEGGNGCVFTDFLKAMTLRKQGRRHSPLFLAARRDLEHLPLLSPHPSLKITSKANKGAALGPRKTKPNQHAVYTFCCSLL